MQEPLRSLELLLCWMDLALPIRLAALPMHTLIVILLWISGDIPQNYIMIGALQDSTQSGLDLAAVLKPITHTSYHIRHVENLPRYFKATVKSMYGHHKG